MDPSLFVRTEHTSPSVNGSANQLPILRCREDRQQLLSVRPGQIPTVASPVITEPIPMCGMYSC